MKTYVQRYQHITEGRQLTHSRLAIGLLIGIVVGLALGLGIALYLQLQISNADMIYPAIAPWILWA